MDTWPPPSLLNRILTPIVLLLAGLAALFWFGYRLYILISGTGAVVVVDKGAYAMLGVGLGLLDLACIVIWEQWLLRPLTKKITAIFSTVAMASVASLFAVPQIIHYCADQQLTAKGYSICEAASHQWLFIRDIVYVQPSAGCSEYLIGE